MTPLQTASHPEVVSEQVPRAQKPWITLVTSPEHKSVGRMYVATSLVFASAAIAEFLMMRVQLMIPENTLIRPEIFDRLLSAFGVTSLILFALPLLIGLMSIVVPLHSVPEGRGLVVRSDDGRRVAIFRVGSAVYAIDDACPHQSASLGAGKLFGTVVECPRHGFLVDVTSGQCPTHPILRARCYEATIQGETVRVALPPTSAAKG